MAGWVDARSSRLSPEHWQRILDVEFGGLNEALYNLYAITHNPRHLEVARRFDHEKIYAPLAEGRDELKGLHANTTIPKIIGAARAYEVTGEPAIPEDRRVFLAASRGASLLCNRRDEQPRVLANRGGRACRRTEQRDAGMLLHLQHAQAHAARFHLDRRCAGRGFLRTGTLQQRARHAESRKRDDDVLRAAGRRVLEDVRFAAGFVLVLQRNGRRVVRQAGRQHLFPRPRIRVGESARSPRN